MESLREQQLQEIEALTSALLLACNEQEWDSLTDLEKRRGELIREFFATAPSADESEQIAAAIGRIQAIDQQVISLCQSHKMALSRKLGDITRASNVKAAYQQY